MAVPARIGTHPCGYSSDMPADREPEDHAGRVDDNATDAPDARPGTEPAGEQAEPVNDTERRYGESESPA